MGIVTKVMLVLIILAGGAGIFFGVAVAPAKISALQEKAGNAKTAQEQVGAKQKEIDRLGADFNLAKGNLDNKLQEVTNLMAKVVGAEKTAQDKVTEAAKAVADLAQKTAEHDALNQKYTADQLKLNDLPKLQSDLAAFGSLKFDGQIVADPNKIQDYLKELETLKKKAPTPVGPVKPAVKTAGRVTNVDPKFGFIQIDFSGQETAVGALFKVKRGGNFVGQIKVVRVQGASSYCQVDKANTPGQIVAGDTVEKSN